MSESFHERFVAVFRTNHERLFRWLDRECGDPDLAEDVVQEAFLRLYRRGSLPDSPEAWLVSVAANLFRSARTRGSRRRRLLTVERSEHVLGDQPRGPEEGAGEEEERARVRTALERLPERERRMLLLRAEGYSYREISLALALNEASVGTLLARAKSAFRAAHEETAHAP